MNKTPGELYQQRAKRVQDAISLRVPDRIPIVPGADFFPFKYAGITVQQGMYEYEKTYAAWKKTIADFEWDMYMAPFIYSGIVFDILGYRQLKWPGRGVSPTSPYQFVEPDQGYEAMPPEDYDVFLDDPSDYLIRRFFPKIFGALEPFSKLPPIHGVICWYQGVFEFLSTVGTPEVSQAFESLIEAGREAFKWFNSLITFIEEMKEMGFPSFSLSGTHAPYDFIGNYLRGTRGIMLDLYRDPERIIRACEKLVPWMIQWGVDGARSTGNPIVSIFLHKGAEGLMSVDQFKTFYWPTLRQVIMGLIDQGLTPFVATEGGYASRLEIIRDVPRAKVIYHIEKDIFRAKEILGDVACLTGGPPNSLLCVGTPGEVKDCCKRIIDVVGKGGGFIMDAEAPIIDAKPENMKALTEFTKEYGVYD